MPNDAKLGLVVGVGLVIAVAVVFFRKEMTVAGPGRGAPPGVVQPAPSGPRPTRLRSSAQTVARTKEERTHTVGEGETLYTVAERYYGDGERFIDLYDANRGTLTRPDRLEPGTVLTIPDLKE